MKEDKSEELYLLIPNPFTGKKDEFDLNKEANATLALRLIRKRQNLIEQSSEVFDELQKARSLHNIDEVEDRIESAITKMKSMERKDEESEDEFNERSEQVLEEIKSAREDYPDEVLDLQSEVAQITHDIERLGLKICSLVLSPTKGVPREYDSKLDYIEEIVSDSQDVNDVITFFLNTLDSSIQSHKGRGIQMKSRKEE